MTTDNTQELEAELPSKMDFSVSFSVTSVELQQSKDMKLLEYLTEQWSRELGLAIGRAKKWDMYPNKFGGMMTKTLQVRVYTHDELMEFADAMQERGRQEERAHTTKLLNEQLDTFQKFIDTSKEINLGYHGRPDCKSCGLMEAIEEAIENERKKLNETGAST